MGTIHPNKQIFQQALHTRSPPHSLDPLWNNNLQQIQLAHNTHHYNHIPNLIYPQQLKL